MIKFGNDARMSSVTSRLSKLKGGSPPRTPKAKGGKVSVVDTGTPETAREFLRADGDMPKARADKPSRSAYASGGRANKSPTTVNVIVAPRGGEGAEKQIVPLPMGGPPSPPAGGPPIAPPAQAGMQGGAPVPTLSLKTGGRVARKDGGRVHKADGGEVPARGKGMAAKIADDDRGTASFPASKRMPKKYGGKVKDAGAGSGVGRMEKY